MGSLETLARDVVNGCSSRVAVVELFDGHMIVGREDTEWRGSVAEWQAALFAALTPIEHYPQLTDWVRAQPEGAFLLAVFAEGESCPSIAKDDANGKYVRFCKEHDLVQMCTTERVPSCVWLSENVSRACELKMQQGVKVYRER